MDRDEKNRPRIPILLQQVRAVITDTVQTGNSGHTLYRIEVTYGNEMLQWVIYREVRDFVALHTYFRTQSVKGILGQTAKFRGSKDGDSNLPSFPRSLLPELLPLQRGRLQFNFDEKEQGTESTNDTRKALQEYLTRLIQCIQFKAQANRICRFLELSAISVQMANMQGELGKQGYLQIRSKSSRKQSFHMVRLGEQYRAPKWFIVRESYILIVEGLFNLNVHDVFLMDQEFQVEQGRHFHKDFVEYGPNENEKNTPSSNEMTSERTGGTVHHYFKRHAFWLRNAERKLKLVAPSEREMEQFIMSIKWSAGRNQFGRPNRFGSFAPIRCNAHAQWLVDGRDYYWMVSEAISAARERIYIHDWWLSPEFYIRRPGTEEWRLDRLLQRKAQEGVRIYVILYNEVSNNFTPTDSNYAKQRLMALHPNIYVQRSPSHIQTGTLYWAHHEKLCVIDEMIAFIGGFDLSFGRWDTAMHVLVDDPYVDGSPELPTDPSFIGPVKDRTEAQIWPGQDYANERVAEWHTLNKPEMDLIPRDKCPRMPWHDVGTQLFGQPARDLCRHFCQRWNSLLRSKKHTRLMPFLMPPPDLTPLEMERYGVKGTCEIQILRSAGPWSLNTPKTVEHSIQNAYLKTIQLSDHFVYIENQFFVTSTAMDGVKVENQIGLALVDRIVRAHRENRPWRAIIVIPLTPGFPSAYDNPDSGSVRIIQLLQYLSMSRGPNSIYGRLLRAGVDPTDYIQFFSLRGWGQLRAGRLTTEQVYIHGKLLIADDRVVIMGSANVNDRSQRGDRDSELACVVRDEDMIESTMAGEPYKVGRFAHTLRVRLMREHVGLDVDQIEQDSINGNTKKSPSNHAKSPTSERSAPSMRRSRPSRGVFEPPFPPPEIPEDAFEDPIAQDSYNGIWLAAADYNMAVYRQVFQCTPDDEVKTWTGFKRATLWANRLSRSLWTKPREGSGDEEAQWAGPSPAPDPDVFSAREIEQMVSLLHTCRGHLVHHPLHFMEQEAAASNFLFPMDEMNPTAVFD
ncbi:phospholipase D [Malassezia psittaci]|uniref:Phospholipase n=1 Tax=Malassezia psittaci TaxID=1821823 RepID=A0AAF0JC90_9BASI|nr:phospholipase D [Malassezia psittaci]